MLTNAVIYWAMALPSCMRNVYCHVDIVAVGRQDPERAFIEHSPSLGKSSPLFRDARKDSHHISLAAFPWRKMVTGQVTSNAKPFRVVKLTLEDLKDNRHRFVRKSGILGGDPCRITCIPPAKTTGIS